MSSLADVQAQPHWIRLKLSMGWSMAIASLLLAIILGFVILLPFTSIYDPYSQNLMASLAEIGDRVDGRLYVLGADALGRDMLSRLALAGRVSIFIGLSAVLISLFVGV